MWPLIAALWSAGPSQLSAPTEQSTRHALERAKDRITVRCAKTQPALGSIVLDVEGLASGRAQVSTPDERPFARCFVTEANKLERGGGDYDGPTSRYRFRKTLKLAAPSALLERAFARISGRAMGCLPRPGAVPRSASFELVADEAGLTVRVQTSPSNKAIDACFEKKLQSSLQRFGKGSWSHRFRQERKLSPRVTGASLKQALWAIAPRQAAACDPKGGKLSGVTVSVRAKRDAPAFEIELRSGNKRFDQCLAAAIEKDLRRQFSVLMRRKDGAWKRYFRIDGEASASFKSP